MLLYLIFAKKRSQGTPCPVVSWQQASGATMGKHIHYTLLTHSQHLRNATTTPASHHVHAGQRSRMCKRNESITHSKHIPDTLRTQFWPQHCCGQNTFQTHLQLTSKQHMWSIITFAQSTKHTPCVGVPRKKSCSARTMKHTPNTHLTHS
jgi:hypothetical protein